MNIKLLMNNESYYIKIQKEEHKTQVHAAETL